MSTTTTQLSTGARLLRMWREDPAAWLQMKIDITPCPYRSAAELEELLLRYPGGHEWAREQHKLGNLVLDPQRSYQAEAMQALAQPGRYLWQWANGTGKTGALALVVLWFLDVYPEGIVLTTAGTWRQVKDQLWREIPHWAAKAITDDFCIQAEDVNRTGIDLDNKWFAVARAAASEETFEGIHGKNVLIIFDEGKAIGDDIYKAARRILRGEGGWQGTRLWWLVASSPGSPSGAFYDAATSNRWKVSRVSAYESAMISTQQIQDDHDELGPTSPLFKSMVEGQFPLESDETMLPLSLVLSMVNNKEAQRKNDGQPERLGVDVARFGSDETVLAYCKGSHVADLVAWRGKPTTETTGRVVAYARDHGVDGRDINVDDTGIGGAVVDNLREMGMRPRAINNGSPAPGRAKKIFTNWITYAWDQLRQKGEAGLVSIPDDKVLINQLSSRKRVFQRNGQVRLETKDEIRGRGGTSPDRAEGVVYGVVPYRSVSRKSGTVL